MEEMMEFTYDEQHDILYISVGVARPAISRELGDDVLLRVDSESGEVLGLTILNLSKHPHPTRLPIALLMRPTD